MSDPRSSTRTIGHVLPFTALGGTEYATLRIATSVDPARFRHVAFCVPEAAPVAGAFRDAGIPVAFYQPAAPSYRHAGSYIRASVKLAREIRRNRVHLLHCADLLAGHYAALAGRLAGVPVVCHIRARFDPISRRDCSFLWPVDRFVFVSRDTRDHFSCRKAASAGVVIYDGIDATTTTAVAARGAVREEFGIAADAPLIGMVARVAPVKDYPTLISASTRILQSHPEARFLIIGDHTSPAYREHYTEVRRLLEQSGVTNAFVFTGDRPDVPRLLAALDVFVLSTHREGLPLVILEAMAFKKPVVATAVGGIPELVHDGETGLLVRHLDAVQLADGVIRLLGDPLLADRLGAAAQRLVQTHFSTARFAADMNTLYSAMLEA